jgi:hypothetical protein
MALRAKYGKWDDPEVVCFGEWRMLKAALQGAGCIDPDEVADGIGKRMKFEGPFGMMIQIYLV